MAPWQRKAIINWVPDKIGRVDLWWTVGLAVDRSDESVPRPPRLVSLETLLWLHQRANRPWRARGRDPADDS